tara:strand:+ start:617 stop:1453 length:837 start_codon:yes stop_codon:yes gene_type:complete
VSKIFLSNKFIKSNCKLALKEDHYPSGDITSNLLVDNIKKKFKLITNQNCIIGGLKFANQTFKLVDKKIKIFLKKKEGARVKKGDVIAIIEGNIKNILAGERVAINYIAHISGIATKTNQFVKKVGKKTKISCTRKTIPNLRIIQKYSVKLGGGYNNRFNLSDEYMIKDNHIGATKNFQEIIKKAIRLNKRKKITVEVDTLKQFKKIVGLKFDTVLFDNMSPKQLKLGVKLAKKKYETEASGGINLKNVKKIANTGVDKVSIGSLTHSINAIDLKLEI